MKLNRSTVSGPITNRKKVSRCFSVNELQRYRPYRDFNNDFLNESTKIKLSPNIKPPIESKNNKISIIFSILIFYNNIILPEVLQLNYLWSRQLLHWGLCISVCCLVVCVVAGIHCNNLVIDMYCLY